jgi:4-amino-4-deoxy-L-arabinose transferase-like glycosyltransferase
MTSRLRATVARVPRAGRIVTLVALVNALVWSIVVPPFQVPDEITHFGYAQYLAQTGKPPPGKGGIAQYSDEEQRTLERLHFFTVVGHVGQRGVWAPGDDAGLRAMLATHPSRTGAGGSSSATNQPPLYYALEAIPYWLSPSHDILTRLALMRSLSALLAAGTVLCVFLFIRELLPGTPWAWTVGALAVAFQPTFMFISAGVHGDNLLFLASAATLLALARAFRRGLTLRRGLAIGFATVVGVLGKLTFLAFLPGVALAFALLIWRAEPRARRGAWSATGAAAAVVALPVAAYLALNSVAWGRSGGVTAGVSGATVAAGTGVISLKERLDYIWQLALPRLPFMHAEFAGFPPWQIWFKGFIGRFGWLDYGFPAWVYHVAFAAFVPIIVLAVATLVLACRHLRWRGLAWRVPLTVTLLVLAVSLIGVIGWQGIGYRHDTGFQFEQARYLLPLLGLYGLVVALAARGAGRRWGPAVGGLLVVLAMAHGLFAELLTISRYYG